VTGASLFTGRLDQYWVFSYAGAPLQDMVRLHPVQDTALCLDVPGPNLPLMTEACGGSASQEFIATALFYGDRSPWFLTTPDALYCVQASAGTAATVAIVVGPCRSNRDVWTAALPLNRLFYSQYVELYADSGGGLRFSMSAPATGGSGSAVTVQADHFSPGQVWTDLAAGPSQPPGNPDGSISLRPLSNHNLCLTVPNSDYSAGVGLTVQTCSGTLNQEFLNAPTLLNSRELIARGNGRFCVGEPGSVGAGNPVELEPCDQLAHQAWMQYYGWSSWVGIAQTIVSHATGGQRVTLISAGTGQVGLAAALAGATTQFWAPVTQPHGLSLQSVYDPGLCLDAPSQTAGTVLDAAACDGGPGKVFVVFVQPDTDTVGYQLGGSKLCVTATGTSAPLELQTCVLDQQNQEWAGPS